MTPVAIVKALTDVLSGPERWRESAGELRRLLAVKSDPQDRGVTAGVRTAALLRPWLPGTTIARTGERLCI